MKITLKRQLWPYKIFLSNILKLFFYRKKIKRTSSFKNLHLGESCFIIGNGPSLKVSDLESINNFKSFASNGIFKIFSETKWRPDYYGVCDKLYYEENKKSILKNIKSFSFYPFDINAHEGDRDFFYLRQHKFQISKPPIFSSRADLMLFDGSTVTYMLIQLAIFMGFKKIYLLGIDFSYSKTVNMRGEVKIDKSIKDYFSGDKSENNSVTPNLEQSYLSYKAALKFCKKKDVQIINLSRKTNLDLFQISNFDSIIN